MRIQDAQNITDLDPDADPEHWQKVLKKSHNRRNQSFSYYFCLMMQGFGSGSVFMTKTDPDADLGGPKTYGSYVSGYPTLSQKQHYTYK